MGTQPTGVGLSWGTCCRKLRLKAVFGWRCNITSWYGTLPKKSTYHGEEGLDSTLVSGKSTDPGDVDVDLQPALSPASEGDSVEAVPPASPLPLQHCVTPRDLT